MTMTLRKRLVFLVLTAFLTLAAVSAEVFVFTLHNHDHAGEYCAVCLEIHIFRQVIEGLARAGAAFIAAVGAARASSPARRALSLRPVSGTPVRLKTRLNF